MRLDQYLVKHQGIATRSKAQDLIRRKLVTVDGVIAKKTGLDITNQNVILLKDLLYVGRGAEKLLGAIFAFDISFKNKVVIDVGSSTGGFTDVALKHGAAHVYAYDVGKQQLDESLRKDARVSVHEETNFLTVSIPKADIIMIDVSFISVIQILKHVHTFKGEIIALIKPQFECGPKKMKHGVLKDKRMHRNILKSVLMETQALGFSIIGLKPSILKGKKGNQEYMMYIDGSQPSIPSIDSMIGEVIC